MSSVLKIFSIAIIFLLIFLAIPLRYPVKIFTPVRGIDVSHHQADINWDSVAADNVSFAYIKASEGGDFRDSLFNFNWAEAEKNSIVRGAYHFLTFCRSGKEQAQNFMDAVGGFSSDDLIPVVDIEYGGNCKKRLTQEEMEELLYDFTAELMTESKNPPVIYMTKDIYQEYFRGKDLKNKIWIRAIISSPRRAYGADWDIWQYLHRGSVDGIKGPVDLNVLRERKVDALLNR